MCEFPREGKNENREGVAGGFKENDNVEYRRVSDDDEFDEFGRRKKKRSSADRDMMSSPGAATTAIDTTSTGVFSGAVSTEESEEDDDEVDDSKYDLFAVCNQPPLHISLIMRRFSQHSGTHTRPHNLHTSQGLECQ